MNLVSIDVFQMQHFLHIIDDLLEVQLQLY